MDKGMQKIKNALKGGISISCKAGGSTYTLERYNVLEAIDILGMNGANPKTKEVLDNAFCEQLKDKLANTGFEGKMLVNSTQNIEFAYEEIYNKLFAFDLVEFCYNVHDDVEKIKLTKLGVDFYKAWKKGI